MMTVRPLTQWHRYAFTLVALFLFSQISLQAATVTWIGGNANWNVAANWDTGALPTAADHVVINAGRAKVPGGFVAVATSVEVQGADLWIRTNGELLLANATDRASLEMNGRMRVDGYLEILNSLHTFPLPNSGDAMISDGSSTITSSGTFIIDQTDGFGIFLDFNGTFTNRGQLTLSNIGSSGIFNRNTFDNEGNIDATIGTISTQAAISNFGNFNNFLNGEIHSSGGGTANIANTSGATINNWGEIHIDNAGNKGITNDDEFYNHVDALINVSGAGSSCIYNMAGGTYYNYGTTEAVLGASEALLNNGLVYNFDLLNLIGGTYAYRDYSTATLKNLGLMYFQSTTGNSMSLNGYVSNNTEGNIFVYKKIYVGSTGVLNNYGFLTSDYTATHWKSGSGVISNYGAINDIHNSFGTYIDNHELVSRPLTNPMQNGVPYPDVLDIVSLSDFTVGTFTTASGGPVAGSYDPVTNEFTPNPNAIGITSMRVIINNNSTGSGLSFTINLSAPVLPMVGSNGTHHTNEMDLKIANDNANDLNAFPNPTTGNIQLSGTSLKSDDVWILIFNNLGQVVMEKNADSMDALELTLPNHFPSGVYRLQCIRDGKSVASENILLQRN